MANRELAVTVYVDGQPYGPGEVPARIAKKITNPKVWVSDEDTSPADPPAPAPANPPSVYAGFEKADLETEVAKRNETRADDKKIVVPEDATADAVAALLDADDAASAAS